MATFNSIKSSVNLITGCGSGLGKATLQWFLKQGCGPLLCIDKSFEPNFLDQLQLEDGDREKISLKEQDTFNEIETASSIEEFVSKNGSFTNVINAAGVALSFQLYTNSTKENIYSLRNAHDLLEHNTIGTFNIIRLASKSMIEQSIKEMKNPTPRCIINAGCFSTTNPLLGHTFYAASKASIDSMTLAIAREFAPYNIRCNTISVGLFNTRLISESSDKVIKYLNKLSLCPRRIGEPEEFAHLVQSIVENQMINGCCIKLDGGTRIPANW